MCRQLLELLVGSHIGVIECPTIFCFHGYGSMADIYFSIAYDVIFILISLSYRSCDVVMVNSSWTRGHVADIWKSTDIHTVYPPCDVTEFTKLPLNSNKHKHIISVGQFRPEKDHQLQVKLSDFT